MGKPEFVCEIDSDKAERMIRALRTVSFYARINHGDKARDYGEVVNPVLKSLGIKTGEAP